MAFRNWLLRILDLWVILGAIGFGTALLTGTLLLLWVTRSVPVQAELPTPVVTVISPPTVTYPPPTPTPGAASSPTPGDLPLPPSAEDISVGAFVQITDTGGDGLRLRVEPGLESQVRFLGLEAEVFQVRDGPSQVDGHTWWHLVAPFDETRNGWAVANYLAVVQNP